MIYAISGPLIARYCSSCLRCQHISSRRLNPGFRRKSDYADRGYPVRIGNVLS